MLKRLINYRDLLFMLTFRDIKIRYKQAVMGFVWAIFMPIMAVLAGILVKKAISVVSGKPMDFAGVITISVKVLPWTFFISATRFAVQSLVGNNNLVTKIYFPKEVLPFSSILACLFDFFIAASALTVILIFAHIGASIYLLWLPILLFFLVLFTSGLGLLLSSANLFFRDVKYIVEIILMFGIFFTPVFYEASTFGKWKALLLLNPVGSNLEAINKVVVLHMMPDIFWLCYTGIWSISIFFVGLAIFRKAEPLFAENI
ncbi:MAG: ABC transporter permease [Candidatus Omnitrophota bacterium]|nr:ABC transporter permease [Candidatus Omnitrophota bacterium]